jgi:PIN domain nuclease of toxin-antitoxin system
MKYLLDTHAFLWWIADPAKLSAVARDVIKDKQHQLFFSAASAWELAIKVGLGRISLPLNPADFILEQMAVNSMQPLAVTIPHALHTSTLPPHHRDPFDRLIVAQARLEDMSLISVDPELRKYDVPIVW